MTAEYCPLTENDILFEKNEIFSWHNDFEFCIEYCVMTSLFYRISVLKFVSYYKIKSFLVFRVVNILFIYYNFFVIVHI